MSTKKKRLKKLIKKKRTSIYSYLTCFLTSDNFSKKAGKKISKALNRATEMKNARTCCSVLIALSLIFLFASSVIADDVVVLTEDNFDKEVGQDRDALVEFYAPWYKKTHSLSLSQFSVWLPRKKLHRKFSFLENQIEN